MRSEIRFSEARELSMEAVESLYRSVAWSSADKPEQLHAALLNAHRHVTAWDAERLVGAGYGISDGSLVVYYPHLIVHPDYQRQGIGAAIMQRLMAHYQGFHQQSIIADAASVAFYERLGFVRAGRTEPMWIYEGHEH